MSKHINEIFKENLNYYLQLKGKSQKDLAEYLNISTAMANYYATGKNTPRMDKVDKICKFFNIERSELLENREKIQPPKEKTIEDIDFTGIDRIAAHYRGEDFSEEALDAIQDFVEYVRSKNKKKQG